MQTKACLQVARCDVIAASGPSIALAAQSDSLQHRRECLCQRMPRSLAARKADLLIYKSVYTESCSVRSYVNHKNDNGIHMYTYTVQTYVPVCVLYMCIQVKSCLGSTHLSNWLVLWPQWRFQENAGRLRCCCWKVWMVPGTPAPTSGHWRPGDREMVQ